MLILQPTTVPVLVAPPQAPDLVLAPPSGAPVLLGPVLGAPVLLNVPATVPLLLGPAQSGTGSGCPCPPWAVVFTNAGYVALDNAGVIVTARNG